MSEEEKARARARIQEEMAAQQMYQQAEVLQKQREQIMANNVLHTLQAVESKMDEDLKKLDEVGSLNESELDKLREERKEKMRKLAEKRALWRSQGNGEYREVHGEKEFFREVKESERAVIHFYRAASIRCNIVDRHLSDLAPKHLETKFIKVNSEKSPFLVERLNIWMMPSIVIALNGKTQHTICGFDEFGGVDDFSNEMCAYVLGKHKAVFHSGKPPEDPTSSKTVVSRFEKVQKPIRQAATSKQIDDDSDWWD